MKQLIPLSQYITIKPHEVKTSGLVSLETIYVHTATVLNVSEDIEEPELKPGDAIIYQTVAAIHLAGSVIINMDYIPAKLN